jgi:hypothetical protein
VTFNSKVWISQIVMYLYDKIISKVSSTQNLNLEFKWKMGLTL